MGICSTKNHTRLFLASAFLIALELDPIFRPMQLLKSCQTSRHTIMMSSCATVVPSFGLQVTTVMDCGLTIWYEKLVLLLGALLEVRHPHQHLQPKVLRIQLIAQQAQTHLPERFPHPPERYPHPPPLLPRALISLAPPNHPPPFPPKVPSL